MYSTFFYSLVFFGLFSGIYGFYLTLNVLEVSHRTKESGYTFFILSCWWILDKNIVPPSESNLIFKGRISVLLTAISWGIAMAMAISSNEI